jgi:hypothetical protein
MRWIYLPIKIKPIDMQTARMVQAVILMLIVALAASCAVSKEYSSKLFAPRTPLVKDSQNLATIPRFLELDKLEMNPENMVSTDIITGRDTLGNTIALDNMAKTFPVISDTVSTVTKYPKTDSTIIVAEKKIKPEETEPVAKSSKPGEVRNKRTREK